MSIDPIVQFRLITCSHFNKQFCICQQINPLRLESAFAPNLCFLIFANIVLQFSGKRSSSPESRDRPNYLGLSLCPLFWILECPGDPSHVPRSQT